MATTDVPTSEALGTAKQPAGHPSAAQQSRSGQIAQKLNPIFRKGILAATQNGLVRRGVSKYGMRLGAAKFVAGETWDEAIVTLRGLNEKGLRTNTTLLGEAVKDVAAVEHVVNTYTRVLDSIAAEKLTTNIALKLTQLGLSLDEEMAYQNVEKLVKHAASHGNFIRIDMEDSPTVDVTLRIYRRLREAGHDNVGTVLQSYLYRTQADFDGLADLKPNLRLVKGAYLEPESVAYPKKSDVDANYIKLAEQMLRENSFTAIATQDERIIDHVIEFTQREGIDQSRFEFQMLFGVRSQLQLDLVKRGYRVLVATPYGPDWYYYLMRRMAERPANVLFIVGNMFKR